MAVGRAGGAAADRPGRRGRLGGAKRLTADPDLPHHVPHPRHGPAFSSLSLTKSSSEGEEKKGSKVGFVVKKNRNNSLTQNTK